MTVISLIIGAQSSGYPAACQPSRHPLNISLILLALSAGRVNVGLAGER
jgi:hypothetical protein